METTVQSSGRTKRPKRKRGTQDPLLATVDIPVESPSATKVQHIAVKGKASKGTKAKKVSQSTASTVDKSMPQATMSISADLRVESLGLPDSSTEDVVPKQKEAAKPCWADVAKCYLPAKEKSKTAPKVAKPPRFKEVQIPGRGQKAKKPRAAQAVLPTSNT